MAAANRIVSGGTDNHLFLVDLIERSYTGKDADAALGRANITVNKNTVPNDPRSPFVTSGLRIGTPAVTTRGFKAYQAQVMQNARIVAQTLTERGLRIVSGRTDSHLMLVDLRAKGITDAPREVRRQHRALRSPTR